MLKPRSVMMFSVGLLAAGAGVASGQDYPNKPVRMVTAAPGAAGDFVARLVALGLTDSWGQQVIVENRGGSGVIPIEIVAKALPDGYTLLVFGTTLWLLPLIQKVSYNPIGDFSPITLAAVTPLLLVVHPSLPVKSITELIALAKSRPGELNYASGISGSATHLPAELFKAMAGVNIVRVAYKGGAPAISALIGGEVQVMFATASGAGPHVNSGRLRALAVTGAEPSPLAPGLPTVAASGVPGYEVVSRTVILAPAQTPAAIISQLNREIVRFLTRADVKEKLLDSGVQAIGSSPEALAAIINVETAKWSKLIKDAGIAAD